MFVSFFCPIITKTCVFVYGVMQVYRSWFILRHFPFLFSESELSLMTNVIIHVLQ